MGGGEAESMKTTKLQTCKIKANMRPLSQPRCQGSAEISYLSLFAGRTTFLHAARTWRDRSCAGRCVAAAVVCSPQEFFGLPPSHHWFKFYRYLFVGSNHPGTHTHNQLSGLTAQPCSSHARVQRACDCKALASISVVRCGSSVVLRSFFLF